MALYFVKSHISHDIDIDVCLGTDRPVGRLSCLAVQVGCSKDHRGDYSDPTPPACQARPTSQQGHKKSINFTKNSNIEFLKF